MNDIKCGDCEYHNSQVESGCLKFPLIEQFKESCENIDGITFPLKAEQILLWCDGFSKNIRTVRTGN
jgi:hypothetical protein